MSGPSLGLGLHLIIKTRGNITHTFLYKAHTLQPLFTMRQLRNCHQATPVVDPRIHDDTASTQVLLPGANILHCQSRREGDSLDYSPYHCLQTGRPTDSRHVPLLTYKHQDASGRDSHRDSLTTLHTEHRTQNTEHRHQGTSSHLHC